VGDSVGGMGVSVESGMGCVAVDTVAGCGDEQAETKRKIIRMTNAVLFWIRMGAILPLVMN